MKTGFTFKSNTELSRLRNLKKYSQREMVELFNSAMGIKISRAHYASIERGRRTVNQDMAVGIARILGVNIDTLFTNTEFSK